MGAGQLLTLPYALINVHPTNFDLDLLLFKKKNKLT